MEVNNSTNNTQKVSDISKLSLFGTLSGLLICSAGIFTICILFKCRKLTAQIRLMSIHVTFSNVIFGSVYLSSNLYRSLTGTTCNALSQAIPLPLVLFKLFLTVAGLDRLLSLKYSIRYTLWTKRKNAHVLMA